MQEKNFVIFIYNSFADPLFKGNLLVFLKALGAEGNGRLRFSLITYEQEQYYLTEAQQAEIRQDLSTCHIDWHPLQWHSGSFKLLKKVLDLASGARLVYRFKRRHRASAIISLGTVSGGFAFLMSRAFGLRFYGYQYEPHSEFLRDFGIWSPRSISYRILNRLEYLSGMYGEVLSTGTQHMIDRLRGWNSRAKAFILPSCVDESKFAYSAAGRRAVRERFGLPEDRPVVLYLGKFGGIYYKEEIATLFAALQQQDPRLFFLVVTPDPQNEIGALLRSQSVDAGNFVVTVSPYEEVQDFISAADLGVVAIPPLPSQKFRSPIKVGEYLCCGLPYLVCQGISEDDAWARAQGVGVVVSEFTAAEAVRVYPEIRTLLDEPKETQRARCRTAGITYRGLSTYLPVARAILKEL